MIISNQCFRAAPHTPVVPNDEFSGKSKAGIYGDFVVECDATVQRIIDALKEKGLYENTIIILTSDNGSSPHGFPIEKEIEFKHNTSNGYKGRKSHSYEGGHRIPFIVSWPKRIKAGSNSDETICLTDLYATVADLQNNEMTIGEAHDSYSILPVLKGEEYKKPIREATIHHSLNGDFSIRKGDWKYKIINNSLLKFPTNRLLFTKYYFLYIVFTEKVEGIRKIYLCTFLKLNNTNKNYYEKKF